METMLNGFFLIELVEENKLLSNGITVKETRGRRDIVSGLVVNCPEEYKKDYSKGTVWFPLYSANTFVYEGKALLLVHHDDIMMVKK